MNALRDEQCAVGSRLEVQTTGRALSRRSASLMRFAATPHHVTLWMGGHLPRPQPAVIGVPDTDCLTRDAASGSSANHDPVDVRLRVIGDQRGRRGVIGGMSDGGG
ncbi:hypothetical protein BAUCODRAFT_238168 [Baudoinia panamericana UAMH 10762]|uniref:Uncharacterized protein n=1 Tax=Baudoinia panamericana (strain UAMH 10762) TaxID=717646 RepID=M2MA69_BAUPA|nr:uncharacterized protein BAUCODRAFT_238168 [Baudoinia panamericana UAMH 10762]EMC93371.1 hypothetical protein BAUCODRAFT_238168 [Baudoinia panamericana UAMH 10762]